MDPLYCSNRLYLADKDHVDLDKFDNHIWNSFPFPFRIHRSITGGFKGKVRRQKKMDVRAEYDPKKYFRRHRPFYRTY